MKFSSLKILITIALATSIPSVFAVTSPFERWNDFKEVGQRVALTQDLSLDMSLDMSLEVSPETTVLVKKGTVLKLTSAEGLDDIKVMLLEFHIEGCTSEEVPPTEMTLVLAEGSAPEENAEVGVVLERKCELSVFVEWKDLSRPSFFNSF